MTLQTLSELARGATPGKWRQGVVSGQCHKPTHGKSNHPGDHGPDPCVYDYTIVSDDKWARSQVAIEPNITLIGSDDHGPILNEATAAFIAAASPDVVLALCRVAEASQVMIVTVSGHFVNDNGSIIDAQAARDRLVNALAALEGIL